MVYVLLENIDLFSQALLIMLALCLMLLATYYAQNYASIIGWSTSLIVMFVMTYTFVLKWCIKKGPLWFCVVQV